MWHGGAPVSNVAPLTEEVTARLDEIYATENSRIDEDLARAQRRAVAQSS